jgi:amino acid transporter
VDNPQRNYPVALAIVVPLSIATYFLPTFLALGALGNWQDWHTRYFSDAALLIGGSWLGLGMTVAAIITNVSLLNSTVLSSTRMPFAMAEDGYLSPVLTGVHPRFGTPWIAIIMSAAIYCLLAWHSLTQLISIYIWLRIATSLLTVLSGYRLRKTRPEIPRPFRIPWGSRGLAYAVGAPVLMSGIALLGSDKFGLRWGPVALLTGPLAYLVFRRKPGANAQGAS